MLHLLHDNDLEFHVTEVSKKEIELRIEDEDYSLADILRHELLAIEDVEFAGIQPPHPLLRRLVIRVRAKKGSPMKHIEEGALRAAKRVKELREAAEKVLPLAQQKKAHQSR